jgi:putative transposase
MSFIKIWIHYIWATKNRRPVLKEPFRSRLFEHIKENAIKQNIYLDKINGHDDHVHAIVSLGTHQTVDGIAQTLKGESSFWFNNTSGFATKRLAWQDKYYAVSVSESVLPILRAYVDGQVIHHQKKTFSQELEELCRQYGFERLG